MSSLFSVSSLKAAPSAEQVEEMAYLTGLDAYTFGFPLVYMELLKYQHTNHYKNKVTPYHSLHDWFHNITVLDHNWQEGGAPNIDTFYSSAWVDISKEPVILSHPDMGERYFTFELADYFSDNFDYVGMRATGSLAGHYALIGPNWKGKLPEGVKPLNRAVTDTIFVVGRTLYGKDDADKKYAYELMKQYKLTPLSEWGKPKQDKPWLKAPKVAVEALNPTSKPLGHWQSIFDALARFPTPEKHKAMINMMANIGLKAGMNVEQDLDEATKKGLARAAIDGFKKLKFLSTKFGDRNNGWTVTAAEFGEAGMHGQYLMRAAQQSLAGIVANNQEEAVYTYAATDVNGIPLEGDRAYKVHFTKEQLPPGKAFWSITNYTMKFNFVTNEWHKYNLGDRDKGLVYDENGGLTIYYSSTPPKDKESMPNWLPTPKNGNFFTVIRTYIPDEKVLNRTWKLPPLEPAIQ